MVEKLTLTRLFDKDKVEFRKIVSETGLVAVGDTEAVLFRKLLKEFKRLRK